MFKFYYVGMLFINVKKKLFSTNCLIKHIFSPFSSIDAGTELTWDYNYEVGSVADKVMYCYCEAPTCRGRLL